MILVDTSIWIDHLRAGDASLSTLLLNGEVLVHPWVVGEMALGQLSQRSEILGLLRNLPQAVVATDDEVLILIDQQQLFGIGIGYVDAHLLAAARLTVGARLWTRDKRLVMAAVELGLAWGGSRVKYHPRADRLGDVRVSAAGRPSQRATWRDTSRDGDEGLPQCRLRFPCGTAGR